VVVGFLVGSTIPQIMIMLFRSSHFPLLFFACPSCCDADPMNECRVDLIIDSCLCRSFNLVLYVE
jgi:hypothetical protein